MSMARQCARSGAAAALCLCAGLVFARGARGENVSFTTADGCRIAASYVAPPGDKYIFINVHGLGSTKEEWAPFERELRKAGQGWLSLDLRGHGQSLECGGEKADYKTFGPARWAAAAGDIVAAVRYLEKKKIPASQIVLCGASVGANLALKAAVDFSLRPAAVVMLSPGLSYAAIDTLPLLGRRQPFALFFSAAKEDAYSCQSARSLFAASEALGMNSSMHETATGHGVNMFSGPAGPGLMRTIADMAWAKGAGSARKNKSGAGRGAPLR